MNEDLLWISRFPRLIIEQQSLSEYWEVSYDKLEMYNFFGVSILVQLSHLSYGTVENSFKIPIFFFQ